MTAVTNGKFAINIELHFTSMQYTDVHLDQR